MISSASEHSIIVVEIVVVLGSRKSNDPTSIWWEYRMNVELQRDCFVCVERAIKKK